MVKYQKKYTFGWQKSDAVDYTEIGINYADSIRYSRGIGFCEPNKEETKKTIIFNQKS